MGRLIAISAALGIALVLPSEARLNHLPGCIFAQGRGIPRSSSQTPVALRVAWIPKTLTGTDEPAWVFTVTNRTARPRSLGFADSAFGEVQLWRDGRRRYSWYGQNIHLQALWGRDVPARSSWSCIQRDTDSLGVGPARYDLVAYLRTTSGPRPRVRRTIVVQ